MVFNYDKLRGRIKEKCGTQERFAQALGIGKVSLSQRLNNSLRFTQEEMHKACIVLEFEKEDISTYFFVQN